MRSSLKKLLAPALFVARNHAMHRTQESHGEAKFAEELRQDRDRKLW